MKPEQPPIAFFLPQFAQLMVGSKNIKSTDDICLFAAGECGITGIDIPYGMLPDPERMLSDQEYRESVAEHYRKLGTRIIRVSTHTDGQLLSLPEVYMPRFRQFAGPNSAALTRDQLEAGALDRIQKALRLGNLLGTKHHQTFPGGRGVPHHDQWSTLPENWHQYELLFLAMQWTPVFETAHKEGGMPIGFEIGHVVESIQTVQDLMNFRNYLPEHLRYLVKWGVDTSHFDKEDDNACEFVDEAITANLDSPGHAKDAWFNKGQPGARHRQNGLPFKDQAGKFEVFGMGNPASARKFAEVLWRAHEADQFSFGVIEGEAMGDILCPFQGMKLAAENLHRVIDGNDPLCIGEVAIDEWNGPTFETFAQSDVPVTELLGGLTPEQFKQFCELAEVHGLARPT